MWPDRSSGHWNRVGIGGSLLAAMVAAMAESVALPPPSSQSPVFSALMLAASDGTRGELSERSRRSLTVFHRLLSPVVALCLALLAASCAPLPEDALGADLDPATDTAVDPIVGGTRDRAAHPAVLALSIGPDSLCTGSLVAEDLVLTARHCVSETNEWLDCANDRWEAVRERPASEIALLSGDDVRARDRTVLARGSRVIVPRSRRMCGADVALVVLDRPVRAIAPMRIDLRKPIATGDLLTVVGFGARGASASSPYGVRYQRARLPIVDWSANEFTAGRATCSGDSGGPAIDPSTGAIVGVLSRGSSPCTAPTAQSVWTRVSAAKSLLDRARSG